MKYKIGVIGNGKRSSALMKGMEVPEDRHLIDVEAFLSFLDDCAITDEDREFNKKVRFAISKAPSDIVCG